MTVKTAFLNFLLPGVLIWAGVFSASAQTILPKERNGKIATTSSVLSVSVRIRWLDGTFWDSTDVAINQTLVVGEDANTNGKPGAYTLHQNYPNPFNTETAVPFSIVHPSFITIKIFNALGQEIVTLIQGNRPSGDDAVVWDGYDRQGNPAASGVYLYQLEIGQFTQSRKMLLLR